MCFIVLHKMNIDEKEGESILVRPDSIITIEKSFWKPEVAQAYLELSDGTKFSVQESVQEVAALCIMSEGYTREEAERAIKHGLGEE